MNIYVCGWNAGATLPDYGFSSASVLRLGRWIRRNCSKNATVFLEMLGWKDDHHK